MIPAAPKDPDPAITWQKIAEWSETPLRILFLLVLGIVIRWLLFRAIDRFTGTLAGLRPPKRLFGSSKAAQALLRDKSPNERQAQRAKALGSLFKSLATGIIGIVIFAMIMELLGFPLGPFLASAGIVGVALGFGAQSLVKDLVSGVFMLIEDQFGVGDVINMGGSPEIEGTVESVGLRITRIRSSDGVLWHLRNGEILRVGNKSMGWSALTLDLEVAYDEDVERVQQIITDVGTEMAEADTWKRAILEAPKSVGVTNVTAAAVTIRVFGQCKPTDKTAVERELRRRLKRAFDAENVRLPAAT